MSLDRNANDSLRTRRNFQRSRTGAMTADVDVVAPLTQGSSGIFLNLSSTGGLETVSQALKVKLDGSSLVLSASGLRLGTVTTKGDLLTFSTAATRQPVGSNAQFLMADSAQTTGIKWAGTANATISLTTSGISVNLPANSGLTNSAGLQLNINTGHFSKADAAGLSLAILTTKGDLLGFGTSHARLGVGANNQILVADSAQTLGVKWHTPFVFNETPGGTIDGVNTAFTIANTAIANTVQLFKDGLILRPTTDFTHSGSNLTMVVAPAGGSWLLAHYQK